MSSKNAINPSSSPSKKRVEGSESIPPKSTTLLRLLLLPHRLLLLRLLNLPLRLPQLLLRRHIHHHQIEHILLQHPLAGLLSDALGALLGRFALGALVAAACAQSALFGSLAADVWEKMWKEKRARIQRMGGGREVGLRLGFDFAAGDQRDEMGVGCVVGVCEPRAEFGGYGGCLGG